MTVVPVRSRGTVRSSELNCPLHSTSAHLRLGFCLHPLVNLSMQASNRWFHSPLNSLRSQFSDLDRPHQTKIIIFLIVFICFLSICIVTLGVRQIRLSSASEQKHNHVEYVMLQNLADDDDNNDDDDETKFAVS